VSGFMGGFGRGRNFLCTLHDGPKHEQNSEMCLRAEIERLTQERTTFRDSNEHWQKEALRVAAERDALRAEVERLRAELNTALMMQGVYKDEGEKSIRYHNKRAEQMTALAMELAGALAELQKQVDDWNEGVSTIIGRVPKSGMAPRKSDAALARAREAGVLG